MALFSTFGVGVFFVTTLLVNLLPPRNLLALQDEFVNAIDARHSLVVNQKSRLASARSAINLMIEKNIRHRNSKLADALHTSANLLLDGDCKRVLSPSKGLNDLHAFSQDYIIIKSAIGYHYLAAGDWTNAEWLLSEIQTAFFASQNYSDWAEQALSLSKLCAGNVEYVRIPPRDTATPNLDAFYAARHPVRALNCTCNQQPVGDHQAANKFCLRVGAQLPTLSQLEHLQAFASEKSIQVWQDNQYSEWTRDCYHKGKLSGKVRNPVYRSGATKWCEYIAKNNRGFSKNPRRGLIRCIRDRGFDADGRITRWLYLEPFDWLEANNELEGIAERLSAAAVEPDAEVRFRYSKAELVRYWRIAPERRDAAGHSVSSCEANTPTCNSNGRTSINIACLADSNPNYQVAFVATYLISDRAIELDLITAADDHYGLWMDGKRLTGIEELHCLNEDPNEVKNESDGVFPADRTRIMLQPGKAHLLVAWIANATGSWAFSARLQPTKNSQSLTGITAGLRVQDKNLVKHYQDVIWRK